jgi:16S rRNA (cytosine967-C5)-methyltransferase
LILGLLRDAGIDPSTIFTGEGYGPAPLTEDEQSAGRAPEGAEAFDIPDWLLPHLAASVEDVTETASALRERAPVFLRVNSLRGTVDEALEALSSEGITAQPHPLSPSALEVSEGARRIHLSQPYLTGLVELQDAASQAVVDRLPLSAGMRVLDYCAGGGGKALAMAARLSGPVEAHDADPRRMSDLTNRADRAAGQIIQTDSPQGYYDLILCDAPCSGSGAWRRSPGGKWLLTAERLAQLQETQVEILQDAVRFLTPGGVLAYATCSVLADENDAVVTRFLAEFTEFTLQNQYKFLPQQGGDGFFLALFGRNT